MYSRQQGLHCCESHELKYRRLDRGLDEDFSEQKGRALNIKLARIRKAYDSNIRLGLVIHASNGPPLQAGLSDSSLSRYKCPYNRVLYTSASPLQTRQAQQYHNPIGPALRRFCGIEHKYESAKIVAGIWTWLGPFLTPPLVDTTHHTLSSSFRNPA